MSTFRSLISFLFIFVSVTTFAQTLQPYSGNIWGAPSLFPYAKLVDVSKFTQIDVVRGTPYLHDEFIIGIVYYNGFTEVSQLPLRFNILTAEFEVVKNDSIYIFAEPERIDRILLKGEVFIYIAESAAHDLKGFVKMWDFELPTIVTRMNRYIEELPNIPNPHKLYDYKNPVYVLSMRDEHYVMKSDKEVIQLKGIKRGADLSLLAAEVSSQSAK
jgi:hypothetical protein